MSLPAKDRVFACHPAWLLLKAAIRASQWYFRVQPNSNGVARYLPGRVEDLKLKVALILVEDHGVSIENRTDGVLEMFKLRNSSIRMKRKGERGSPC